MNNIYVVLIIVLIIVIILVLERNACARMFARAREGLCAARDCVHRRDALLAYDIGAEGQGLPQGLPYCEDRYRGISPFLPPNRKCYTGSYNPFWAPFGDGGIMSEVGPYFDVPVSRMIGDHVPPE
jgi:hypothetical protein